MHMSAHCCSTAPLLLPHFQTIRGCAGWRPVARTLSRFAPTKTSTCTSFDTTMNRQVQSMSRPLLWCFDRYTDFRSSGSFSPCGQCSKCLLSKIRHFIVSFVASFSPLFCPRSRHLLSLRASRFSQILFFSRPVSVVFVSLSHIVAK